MNSIFKIFYPGRNPSYSIYFVGKFRLVLNFSLWRLKQNLMDRKSKYGVLIVAGKRINFGFVAIITVIIALPPSLCSRKKDSADIAPVELKRCR